MKTFWVGMTIVLALSTAALAAKPTDVPRNGDSNPGHHYGADGNPGKHLGQDKT